jgi:hypothetical protein
MRTADHRGIRKETSMTPTMRTFRSVALGAVVLASMRAFAFDISCVGGGVSDDLERLGLPTAGQCYYGTIVTPRMPDAAETGRYADWTIGHVIVSQPSSIAVTVVPPTIPPFLPEYPKEFVTQAWLYPSAGDDPRPYFAVDSDMRDGIDFLNVPAGLYDLRIGGTYWMPQAPDTVQYQSAFYLGVAVVSPVPEPGIWALMIAGLAVLGGIGWGRRPRGSMSAS